QRFGQGSEPGMATRVQPVADENGSGWSRCGPGWIELIGSNRGDEVRIVVGREQYRSDELVPAHRRGVGDVEGSGGACGGEMQECEREIFGERGSPDLIVDKRHGSVFGG